MRRDDDALDAAAAEPGTTTERATVNAALANIADRQHRTALFNNPLVWGGSDLTDGEVMAGARR